MAFQPQDLYVKLVDPNGKHAEVPCYHRVWDKQLFLSSLQTRHLNPSEPGDRREVVVIDERIYNRMQKGSK